MTCVGVVTGGNRGLGFSVVRQLAATPGVRVVLTARSLTAATEAVKEIQRELPLADVMPRDLDITSEASVVAFSQWISEDFKDGLDFIVNNAGFAYPGESAHVPFAKQAEDTLTPNYFGTLRVTRALLPNLRPSGRIISVASTSGLAALMQLSPVMQQRAMSADCEEDVTKLMLEFLAATRAGDHEEAGFPSNSYGMSKLGIMALTRVLGKDGVSACCMCPGWCLTDMATEITRTGDAMLARTAAEGAYDITFLAVPGRLGGDPRGSELAGKFIRPMQPYMLKFLPAELKTPWSPHELFSLANQGRLVPPAGGRSSL